MLCMACKEHESTHEHYCYTCFLALKDKHPKRYERVKGFLIREEILKRDQYTCYFCEKKANTIDHLQPISKDGKSTYDNCVACCEVCNLEKNTLTENEYWAYIKKRETDSKLQKKRETLQKECELTACHSCQRVVSKYHLDPVFLMCKGCRIEFVEKMKTIVLKREDASRRFKEEGNGV